MIPPEIKYDGNATPPQFTDNGDQVIERGTQVRIRLKGIRFVLVRCVCSMLMLITPKRRGQPDLRHCRYSRRFPGLSARELRCPIARDRPHVASNLRRAKASFTLDRSMNFRTGRMAMARDTPSVITYERTNETCHWYQWRSMYCSRFAHTPLV